MVVLSCPCTLHIKLHSLVLREWLYDNLEVSKAPWRRGGFQTKVQVQFPMLDPLPEVACWWRDNVGIHYGHQHQVGVIHIVLTEMEWQLRHSASLCHHIEAILIGS